ncbi:MAG: ornithine carbamoyltransferase [Candidatus Krumholzibacteria bacterium]|jgi:ornithine carbamoyltransferase|nr:ornithine carbamoyltransferase [Candidatus Krumholzibacteria bacterium]MDP6668788.1 ornithine carbamoyltransferase [Candidatus Krumholzibacteria bacterium]MDP6797588.1 ornithine carbamoyltransferase [Candidatus Krumholzibacteria bacterium]MDP7020915.1 ornithine carbamoyltransferase [Candidatus Krumholzibacteria bacterium]
MTFPKDFLSIADWGSDELSHVLELAMEQKRKLKAGEDLSSLKAGKTLALIFHKPSLRTRVSFEVAITQLGGLSLYITDREIGLGSREAPQDVARVMERYVDGIMIRTFAHEQALSLARNATHIPVINGLTDLLHPCQVMADLQTILEHKGTLENLRVVYLGDGNNMANSWIHAAARFPFELVISNPSGYEPSQEVLDNARKIQPSLRYENILDPARAVDGADVIYTDVWASMGQEEETEARKAVFAPYQVNQSLLEKTGKKDTIVMHCLPAHRGDEITDEVLDGPRSVVFDEAENRLHAQRAILTLVM